MSRPIIDGAPLVVRASDAPSPRGDAAGFERHRLEPGTWLEPADGTAWQEVLVLVGDLEWSGARLTAGDYAWAPEALGPEHPRAGVVGAELLAAPGPRGHSTAVIVCQDVHHREWGYLDTSDGSDRLPLRYDRTRGESTWLLRWPAGLTAVLTRATGVSLEIIVLAGDLELTGITAPLRRLDHATLTAELLPAEGQTAGGCELLLRTSWSPAS